MKQLTEEAEELKTTSASAKEEAATAKQELEQARSHIETTESKLQAALLEVEVVKASEESALSQVSCAFRSRYFLRCFDLNLSKLIDIHVVTWYCMLRLCSTRNEFLQGNLPVNLEVAW